MAADRVDQSQGPNYSSDPPESSLSLPCYGPDLQINFFQEFSQDVPDRFAVLVKRITP